MPRKIKTTEEYHEIHHERNTPFAVTKTVTEEDGEKTVSIKIDSGRHPDFCIKISGDDARLLYDVLGKFLNSKED